LYNVPEIEIRLSVAYEVNFFTDQFLHYFVAATTPSLRQRKARLTKRQRSRAGKNSQIVET
jgi:hypothetical protein